MQYEILNKYSYPSSETFWESQYIFDLCKKFSTEKWMESSYFMIIS